MHSNKNFIFLKFYFQGFKKIMSKSVGIFGELATTRETGKVKFTPSEEPIKDYVFRKTGLQETLINTDRYKNALSDPGKYLSDKQNDLITIGDNLSDKFGKEYERLLNLGITEEKARKSATEYVQSEKIRLLRTHETEYPTKITEDIVKRAFKGGKGVGNEKNEIKIN